MNTPSEMAAPRSGGDQKGNYVFVFTNDPVLRLLLWDAGFARVLELIAAADLRILGSEPGLDAFARQLAERADRKDGER